MERSSSQQIEPSAGGLSPREAKPSRRRRVVTAIAALVGLAWYFRGYLHSPVSRYLVDGPSMEPAYHAGQRVLVNRLAYALRAPADGDVVVLRDPEDDGRILVKRVARAAAPEPAAGGVYVLGDNPSQSRDSRHFGAVSRKQILGKALLSY